MPKPMNGLTRAQLGRLLRLILLLRGGRYPNASALAELSEVSRRTVYRDLRTLDLGGIPVRFRADLGGYEIAPGFFLEASRLEESEAVALAIQVMRPGPKSGPDRSLAAYLAIQKVAQSLPDAFRDKILAIIEALREGSDPLQLDDDRSRIHEALVNALAKKQTIRIWLREPGSSGLISTKISPLHLTLAGDSWRLTGRSTFHRRVQTIRVATIVQVVETGELIADSPSTLHPLPKSEKNVVARLRFDERVVPDVLDRRWPQNRRFERKDDGSLVLAFVLNDLEGLVGWILSLGDLVEVLGPLELRDRIREIARSVSRLNAPPLERTEANSPNREALSR